MTGEKRSWTTAAANVASITGVSLATVLGATYAGKINIDNVFKVAIFGAIFLAVAAFISALFFALSDRIRAGKGSNGYKYSLVAALWLAFASGASLFAYWGVVAIGGMQFIS